MIKKHNLFQKVTSYLEKYVPLEIDMHGNNQEYQDKHDDLLLSNMLYECKRMLKSRIDRRIQEFVSDVDGSNFTFGVINYN